jgi:hypothetical protein
MDVEHMDEVTRRAFETLERLDAADQQREQQRAAQRALGYDDSAPYEEPIDMTWDPANPPGLTVATMNQREFSAWVDAGRPPLEKAEAAAGATASRDRKNDYARRTEAVG